MKSLCYLNVIGPFAHCAVGLIRQLLDLFPAFLEVFTDTFDSMTTDESGSQCCQDEHVTKGFSHD